MLKKLNVSSGKCYSSACFDLFQKIYFDLLMNFKVLFRKVSIAVIDGTRS